MTSAEHKDINIAEFLSVLIFLSEECGKVIRRIESSGELEKITKVDDSPVTLADLQVQKTIEVCLQSLYPTLTVEGEESK
jgi:3'-phosphoadenosine 5'-phosphosulfate (PAPS) 3'-phosphatase